MKILIFGTGDYYQRYKAWLAQDEIMALLDNSSNKQGTWIDGIQVLSPEEGIMLPFDKIIVLSFYIREMRKQLIELGVNPKDILHFYDLHNFLKGRVKLHGLELDGTVRAILDDGREKKRTVLLLSTDLLSIGGPAKTLFRVAKLLKKNGCPVLFASMLDGSLREELVREEIPVLVDRNLQISTMEECTWTEGFRLVICNTINFYVFLSERSCKTPICWWLHDSEFFYGGVNGDILREIRQENLKIVSVGMVPEQAMHSLAPNFTIGRLLYGVDDCNTEERKPDTVMSFATMGYVEKRKGQDILVEAVRRLPEEERAKAHFYIIGNDTSALAVRLKHETEEIKEISITGVLQDKEYRELMDKMEVLVCPSREDPMPAVVAEAMTRCVPCIVSDKVGFTEYIENEKNGWVFENGDSQELSERILWCIGNREKIHAVGRRARTIYEQHFSMENFERKLMELVYEMTGIVQKD